MMDSMTWGLVGSITLMILTGSGGARLWWSRRQERALAVRAEADQLTLIDNLRDAYVRERRELEVKQQQALTTLEQDREHLRSKVRMLAHELDTVRHTLNALLQHQGLIDEDMPIDDFMPTVSSPLTLHGYLGEPCVS